MNIFSKMKAGILKSQEAKRHAEAEEEVVSFVMQQSERRRLERMSTELQWQLNANFLYGNQHCDINLHRMTVENYEPMYDYLSREAYNRIAPLLETRMANLQTVRYNMTVKARSGEYEDILKASVSTALLRAKQEQSDFAEKLDLAIHWCELTGNAFFLSGWNDTEGKTVSLVEGESTDPLALDSGADVEYTVLTPYEVFPDNLCVESIRDQQSILIEQVKSVAEIEGLYGVAPQPCEISTLFHRQDGIGRSQYSHDSVILYTYMERPSAAYPKGRLILVAGQTLIYNGDLPYRDIPLCQMKCHTVPGQFFGRSVIENLIPLQRTYNGIKNKINDYINLAASGQMVIEEGSLDVDDLQGGGVAPGIPVVYGKGSEKPSLLPIPTLPDIVAEQCDRVASDMEYVAGVSQLMVSGTLPVGITSGTAIDTLRQIDSTRLALTADNIRQCVCELAVIWLWMYHDFGGKDRALMAKGRNEMEDVLYWSADQINSFEVFFDTENELKQAGSDRVSTLLSAIGQGLYNDENKAVPKRILRRARHLMVGEGTGIVLEEDLQEQNARRENLRWEKGEAPKVGLLDDHEIHLGEHRLYALQNAFSIREKRDPDHARKMIDHIFEHVRMMNEGREDDEYGK